MFGECHAHVIMDGINYKAAVAASICFLSARDSFFLGFSEHPMQPLEQEPPKSQGRSRSYGHK